jgi:hypothetical protein
MKIYLDGYFSFYIGGDQQWIEVRLDEPARLSEVLAGLGIPVVEVHLTVIDGKLVDPLETVVDDTYEVRLYPPVGGG